MRAAADAEAAGHHDDPDPARRESRRAPTRPRRSRSTTSTCSTDCGRRASTRKFPSSPRNSGSISTRRCASAISMRLVDRAEARRQLRLDRHGELAVRRSTIALFRRMRAQTPRVGIALQAYLYRTEKDVESLVPLGAAIRIVKGAYLEPPEVAYPKKADVDENFYKLCTPAAGGGCAPAGRPAAHRDARHRRWPTGWRRYIAQQQGAGVRLRVRDAVRHPAAASSCGSRARAGRSAS